MRKAREPSFHILGVLVALWVTGRSTGISSGAAERRRSKDNSCARRIHKEEDGIRSFSERALGPGERKHIADRQTACARAQLELRSTSSLETLTGTPS